MNEHKLFIFIGVFVVALVIEILVGFAMILMFGSKDADSETMPEFMMGILNAVLLSFLYIKYIL